MSIGPAELAACTENGSTLLLSKDVPSLINLDDSTAAKEEIGRALGRLASGVYIVTWVVDNNPQGLLATWIAQAAFEPPMVTVAINKQRKLAASIEQATVLTINVLSKENMDIFKAFARPASSPEQDRFADLDLLSNAAGGPVFSKAVSFINGKTSNIIDAGDHLLALLEITSGALLNGDAEPMTHLRKSGFQY